MGKLIKYALALEGKVTPPGDKSLSHRAVIFNGMAEGKATVENFLAGADCLATVAIMMALGVDIDLTGEAGGPQTITINGAGGQGLKEPTVILDAQNSGTTMRLLTGLLASHPFFSVLTGDASLRSRPMGRIVHPLQLMGAQIWGREGDTLAPLAIRGGMLRGIDYPTPIASAQLKSSIILAALYAKGTTTITEPAASRDHTERVLRAMGAEIKSQDTTVTVTPLGKPLKAVDIRVPGDISSAAFWLVAGVAHPNARITVENVGMNPTRTGILEVLKRMGANLRVENLREEGGEPVANLVVESSSLMGTTIQGAEIPTLIDELPVLALAACVARGETTIKDAAELRVKESDRIATTVGELSKLGARLEELPDGMVIHGGASLVGAPVHSHSDHRLAMTLGVAGLIARGETVISDPEVVEVSYPGFWEVVERLSRSLALG